MQELIKIEKRVIGAEEINSVNARELCGELGIGKDFTNWIKTQINRAGLRKDVDYIIVSVKSSGVRSLKEYYITTDASKHIAMMSQGAKAKEVRDYFIAVEKEYKASVQGNNNDALNQILPLLQGMMQMMSVMVENQNKMMELLLETQTQQKLLVAKGLTPEQLSNIKLKVLKAAKPLAQISPNDYDEAIETLDKWTRQKEDELVAKKIEDAKPVHFVMPDFI